MRLRPLPFGGVLRDRILAESIRRLTESTDRRLSELERGVGEARPRSASAAAGMPARPRRQRLRVSVGVTIFAGGEFLPRCLNSVLDAGGFDQLILVCDGEDASVEAMVRAFAAMAGAQVFVHDRTLGYTASANQILLAAAGDVVVLLNSDTIVPQGWIDRLLVPFADPGTGLVGPWSNAATAQSVPDLPALAGYAANDLPVALDVEAINAAITATMSAESPMIPALNGFCLAVRRDVVHAVGLFDAIAFEEGYGEELDYALRAAAAGFALRVADTLYIHHAKSQSFGALRRESLSARGKDTLRRLYGDDHIAQFLAALRTWSETSPQRAEMAELLRALADGGAPAGAAPRIGVYAPAGSTQPGFRPLIDAAWTIGASAEPAARFDTLVALRWQDIEPAASLAGGQDLISYLGNPADLAEAVSSAAGLTALRDQRVRRHLCSDRVVAAALYRHTGLRAAILPQPPPTARPVSRAPSLVIVNGPGAARLPGGSVDAIVDALHASGTVAVAVISALPAEAVAVGAGDAEIERRIGSADYCLDLRATGEFWRSALAAIRLGTVPLVAADDGLGEILAADVGDIVLPVVSSALELRVWLERAIGRRAGQSLLAADPASSRPAESAVPASWVNAIVAGSIAGTFRRRRGASASP